MLIHPYSHVFQLRRKNEASPRLCRKPAVGRLTLWTDPIMSPGSEQSRWRKVGYLRPLTITHDRTIIQDAILLPPFPRPQMFLVYAL